MTIREHIANILGMPVYQTLDWCTFTELGLDSLDVMDMQHKLEERLGIQFPQRSYISVGDVVRAAQKLQEEKECTV